MVIRINWVGFLMMTTPSNPKLKRRKSISEALAISAIILLTIDTVNTFTSQGENGFSYLTDRQSGIYLGLPSVFLFFVSFWVWI
jgi:hypothetical protein